MPGTDTQEQGRIAEETALAFLESRGLRLEMRNYRCRGGEIDLVMRDGDSWVFVEVRYRRNSRFGTPQATVTGPKQRRLALAAAHFLAGRRTRPCRFDVVGVIGQPPVVEWIPNAFDTPAWR